MSSKVSQSGLGSRFIRCLIIALAVAYLSPGQFVAQAQQSPPPAVAPTQSEAVTPPAEAAPKIPNDQLDSLVAPIALYPDPLLAQTLAASTYPLEIIQLQQWLAKNPKLKDKALADEVSKQNWDPSVQAMASLPDAVKQLAENISWTTDLGNAFLAQQSDVMEAVQRMRAKAQGAGNLKTSKEQKVESKQVENKSVIVIEQADPQVIYVPVYNPTVVYGPPVYPYPSIYYPPYVAGRVLAFGAGVAIGAAWRNNWGWNCGWGRNDVNININNNYINHFNRKTTNVNQRISNNSNWRHNPQHRGPAPYSNKTVANKFGGNTRGPATNRPGADFPSRGPSADRPNRPSGDRPSADRPNRPSGDRPSTRPSGDRERIGNHNVSRESRPRSNNAFSSGGGFNRNSAMASHTRGSHSMGRGGMRGGGRRR